LSNRWKFKLSSNDEDKLKDLAEDVDFQSNSASKELLAKEKKPSSFGHRESGRGRDRDRDRDRDEGPSHYGPG
jgi:hypothetical protein